MQAIKERIQKNHNTLRRQRITSMITQTRTKILDALNQQFLDHLVTLPIQELSQEDFKILIHMVNNDSAIASIHLSKIIDTGMISQEILRGVKWTLGKNDKWTLLLSALTHSGICSEDFFEYCTKRILVKQSSFNLQHALKMFLHHAKNNESPINTIKQNCNLITAIIAHTHDDSERVSFLAMSILVFITSKDQTMPHYILKSVGLPRILKMLLNSLLKIDPSARALAVQLANNFELSGITLQPIRRRLLDLIKIDKEKVLCEISYFLRSLIEKASIANLIKMTKQYDFPSAINNLKNRQTKKKYAQQISRNIDLCMMKIEQTTSQNLIIAKKQCLDSHEVDIEEVESTIVERKELFLENN